MIVRQIQIYRTAMTFIVRSSRHHDPNETGGILLGKRIDTIALIVAAVGPGSQAQHALRDFIRDGEYAQAELERFFLASGGQIDYLGEWHSHPRPESPSARDRASLASISASADYNCPQPLLILSQRSWGGSWVLRGYQWRRVILVDLPVLIEEDPEA